jgi:hypothetical protein
MLFPSVSLAPAGMNMETEISVALDLEAVFYLFLGRNDECLELTYEALWQTEIILLH